MNEKYQTEINEFMNQFRAHKEQRIVLYGIGRYTATLVEGLKDFQIVGLMDKDPERIGESIFGLPIIDGKTAEKVADIIVINTSETYWDVIYERIKDITIPIYYKNGKLAKTKSIQKYENPFRNLSYDLVQDQIKVAGVVSFDFFDTLFVRKVCSPRDVFKFLENSFRNEWNGGMSYTELRSKAREMLRPNYCLDELYQQMQVICGLPDMVLKKIKQKELELECRLLRPREKMLTCLQSAIADGKEVYIVSDMYLPKSFYLDVLQEYKIEFPTDHILLSNEMGMSKRDGKLWRDFAKKRIGGRKAIHIGDDPKADIEEAEKQGIKTYRVPSTWDMLTVSSMQNLSTSICSDYDTAVMGCVISELFNDPFRLYASDGIIRISNNYEMGYIVFAPVIITFLIWLIQKSRQDHIRKLVFMSRDGYLLQQDFEYLCELIGGGYSVSESCYLGISRQLAMLAAVENEKDLFEYASMPYSGSISELFEDRFEIYDVKEIPGKTLKEYLKDYREEIEKYTANIQRSYRQYLDSMQLDDQCAVVDLGFYGNNQKYLNKIAGTGMKGYYSNANLSAQNPNTAIQKMEACFQEEGDATGEDSWVYKKQIYLESFLTAPYGMVKAVDDKGAFVCAKKRNNQMRFSDKEEINRGVKSFIRDYVRSFWDLNIRLNIKFADNFYGHCFGGALEFSDAVKSSFYNDNAMMNRLESMLFY